MSKNNQGEKSHRYQSKQHASTNEQYSASKSSIPKTMGYPHVPLNSPQEYLRKYSKKTRTDMMKPVTCLCRIKNGKDSPPIPKPHVMPLTLVQNGRRNFVEENIVEAVKHPPMIPTPKMVGSSREKAFSLDESGWVPKYSKIQDFVEVPSYIVKNKQHLRLSKEDFITAKHTQGELQSLSMESKQKILEGLVRNLKELLRRYLTLPLKIDTPVLIKRKNDLENRIEALQRDIDLIRRNKDILIGKGKTDFSLQ